MRESARKFTKVRGHFCRGMGACRKLSTDEIAAMAGRLKQGRNPERDSTLFYLGCYAGGRISSLLSLRIKDVVELDGSPVEVLVFRRSTTKGKNASHAVALSDDCRLIIGEYIDYLRSIGKVDSSAFLFTTRWGSTPISRNHAYYIINRAARQSMLRGVIGNHSMRKTFAHAYYAAFRADYLAGNVTDDPLESLRAALGHADIQSTSKYLAANKDTVARYTKQIHLR